ncbi:reverse transcriptase domain-containing protein [Tanacetum coccineum]|uniref:Reverse transcriptase domain-containing protein n=1 Tax=Tanacetum coccineum TaxID=301880 RepID=A0ABQ5ISK3_9ASTR
MGVRNMHVSVDSKLVANQVLGAYVAKEENMIKYLEKVKILVSGFDNFSISQVPRSKNKKADALSKIASTSFAHLSKQVLVEILKEKSIQEKEVMTVLEEDRLTWMTPIIEYLKKGTLPEDKKEASKLRIKARHMHAGLRSVVANAMRLGYYWPTMHRDIRNVICTLGNRHSWPFPGGTKKGQIFDSRYGLFHKVDIDESRVDNHWQSGEEVRMGQHTVMPAEIGMPMYRTTAVDAVHNDEELRLNLDLLEERCERAAIHEAKAKLQMTKYYNARVRGVTFRPGDFVYRSNDASHAVAGGKLGPKWEGPYEVMEALEDGAYRLRSMDGTVLPLAWNIANLKKCYL